MKTGSPNLVGAFSVVILFLPYCVKSSLMGTRLMPRVRTLSWLVRELEETLGRLADRHLSLSLVRHDDDDDDEDDPQRSVNTIHSPSMSW